MQRKQQISKDNLHEKRAVHTSYTGKMPSSEEASTKEDFTEYQEDKVMERVLESGNLFRALHKVQQNKGAAGIDGMEVATLTRWLKQHEQELRMRLLSGTYEPEAVRRVEIPKASGKGKRLLGIPTAKDRLVQQALLQVLQPMIDPSFSDSSFGFRPGRSAHQAIDQARRYVREGYNHVVDIDLADFFNRVNHDILMSKVARHVSDKRVLRLIRSYLNAGVLLNGCRVSSEEGVPQGGPLSPLLSNIMLDELDKELEHRGHRFCRYADDQNIYVRSRRAGIRVFKSITTFIEQKLQLKVNHEKSEVAPVAKRKFLGFSFTRRGEPRVNIAPESVKRFKAKIRILTSRSKGIALSERIRRLNLFLGGWIRYFAPAETPSIIAQLKSWIQRRLRQCVIRTWANSATWWRRLLAFGLSREEAARMAASSKSWWRLSHTPQIDKAMNNAYWKSHGLIDITALFLKLRNNL